ncbi:flagellar basal-body rod protein FlgF [Tolumonas lignilytica]|jgi:flagellar basal-body rod protein FlgF|uniref:flagellar basal-body rod protein FlgF n=1 Tax=Tolumonas lignilytica TaxID=1283284 RepID=UPI0004653E93|nr:flagellar basal-body rod protein FlgF [Tolumonas lignilytica]
MDKFLYIAMSGAKENLNSLAIRSNNLANANTLGFKADFEEARAMQAYGDGLPSRVFAMTERPGQNFQQGSLQTTGRDLDVAVKGDGWLTVQDANGKEAYTRNGSLQVSPLGILQTSTGLNVLDTSGQPITLPMPVEKIQIAEDGTINARLQGANPAAIDTLQQIKLVNPINKDLTKGDDGLFRRTDGNTEPVSANVHLASGALENSNVNAVEELTNLIKLQRQFDTQIKMMSTAEKDDESQTQLLKLG